MLVSAYPVVVETVIREAVVSSNVASEQLVEVVQSKGGCVRRDSHQRKQNQYSQHCPSYPTIPRALHSLLSSFLCIRARFQPRASTYQTKDLQHTQQTVSKWLVPASEQQQPLLGWVDVVHLQT